MRQVSLNIQNAPGAAVTPLQASILNALSQIADASILDNATLMSEAFTVTNYTETRTLNAATATTSDIANFLCTLVADFKAGGSKSTR